MTDEKKWNLITGKVYRYKNSGKLVVDGGWGYYLDLDQRFGFAGSAPHKKSPKTELEETSWRVEFEKSGTPQKQDWVWRHVRAYNISDLSKSSDDPSLPLEKKLNISPSDLLNDDEQSYAGFYRKTGSWKERLIITTILSGIAFYIHQVPFIVVLAIGLALTIKQLLIQTKQRDEVDEFNQGVDARKQEIVEAKKRVRQKWSTKLERLLSDFGNWEAMSGESFEIATAKLFEEKGFSVDYTPTSNDGGIDLLLSKDEERIGVQCKCYSKNVGVAAVRELHGVKQQWSELNRFILVGLHGFSRQAREFAKQHDVELFSIKRDHFNLG